MGSSSNLVQIGRTAEIPDLKNWINMEIKGESETASISSDEQSPDVETFLTLFYAQQIKEKNKKIVSARNSMMQGAKVDTAVMPIISSATNIRDYYIRQIAIMK